VLERMRTVLDSWQAETGDMGPISEEIMVAAWYPDGKQLETAVPHFVPNAEGNRNLQISTGGNLKSPAMITIYCATEGASIVYSTEEGNNPHWLLYTGPIRLKPGKNRIRSVAIRYGYLQSREQSALFTVE
jgi:N-sulfoglucosamine sulfohydrolase